jgi:hypothetical protein
MTPEVETAIEEIRQTFAGHNVHVESESQGGAHVTVDDLTLGDRYRPDSSWFGFTIPFQYPRADVYPHFVRPDLQRVDGCGLGQCFSGPTAWNNNKPAIQISRRSNRWDPLVDSAAGKLLKVLQWVRNQ